MKTRLPLIVALSAVVGSGVAWAVTPEAAPEKPAVEKAGSTHENNGHDHHGHDHADKGPGDHEHDGPHFSAEDRAAFLDARIAALHAGLKLTPDQEKLWPPVETALRNGMKSVGDLIRQRREERSKDESSEEARPRNPITFLRRLSDFELARGNAAKAIADAAAPLYDTLSPEQKNRLPVLMRGLHHGWMRSQMRGMMGGMMGRGPHSMCGGPEGRPGAPNHGEGPHDHGPRGDHGPQGSDHDMDDDDGE